MSCESEIRENKGMERFRLRTFSRHYRQKYGIGVGKIPLDLGIRCPNRKDGGCIFCNGDGFRPEYLLDGGSVLTQINNGRERFLKDRFDAFFAYFQQETPTALAETSLLPILKQVLELQDCLGLIISTRPDALPSRLLDGIAGIVADSGKQCHFELGLQSVHERSLTFLNRNHGYGEFLNTQQRIRQYGIFDIGVHLLFGIPGESIADMKESVSRVCNLGIESLKFHHLQVLRKTALAHLYAEGRCPVFEQQEYLDLLLELIPIIPQDVILHRLWATAHPKLLIAPKWNVLATVLSQKLQTVLEKADIWQGMNCQSASSI